MVTAARYTDFCYSGSPIGVQNEIPAKDVASSSGQLRISSSSPSIGPKTGDKRSRELDLEPCATSDTRTTFGHPKSVSTIDQRDRQETQPMQESSKLSRTNSFVPVNVPAQSLLEGNQTTAIHNLLRDTARRPPTRSPSPTIRGDETMLRCDLTSEINIQREKHRNLNAGCLHSIRKLLKKARIERPKMPDPEDPLMADEWLDEDEMMEICTAKLEKGGRCSRALLSRLEYFLYGPLMSPQEKRTQELSICVEECVSTSKAAPYYNQLLLHRLGRILDDPAAYDLREQQTEIKSLRGNLNAALANKSALDRPSMRKFAQLLDPEGLIANPNLESPKATTEATKKSFNLKPRKVTAKSAAPFAPSPDTSISPSKTTRLPPFTSSLSSTKTNPLSSLQTSSATLPPASSVHGSSRFSKTFPTTFSTGIPTHPSTNSSMSLYTGPSKGLRASLSPAPSPGPSLGYSAGPRAGPSTIPSTNPPLDPAADLSTADSTIDPRDDDMRPLTKDEQTCLRPTEQTLQSQRRKAAQENASSTLNAPYTGTARPTGSGKPSIRRVSLGNSDPPAAAASASPNMPAIGSSIGTARPSARSQPPNRRTSTPAVATTAALVSSYSNKCPASADQLVASDSANKLWKIFLADVAPVISILDLDQLNDAFTTAVNDGKIGHKIIDPTLGFCLAMASRVAKYEIRDTKEWYSGAKRNLKKNKESRKSFEYFQKRILQIRYLIMIGELSEAWRVMALVTSEAQSNRMQYGGHPGQDEKALGQVRMIWQSLCAAKISLTLHLGFMDQTLEPSAASPMPTVLQMKECLRSSVYDNRTTTAMAHFFLACASLSNFADDIVRFENDLRLTRSECPMKWLSTVDPQDYVQLDQDLANWEKSLPEYLRWKAGDLMESDRTICRLNLQVHVQYVHFRLRQHRPYLILAFRLSSQCACEDSPHLSNKERPLGPNIVLGIIRDGAVQCLTAAQDIVKTYWSFFEGPNNHNPQVLLSETVDCLYTAGLILIAARCISWLTNGAAHRSLSVLTEEIRQVDVLLRSCEQDSKETSLFERVRRCRGIIHLVSSQALASDGTISDQDIPLKESVWLSLYQRLALVIPFNFSDPHATQVGRRMHFGWLESLPVDMDDDE
jgi:hypothetical protein